LKLIPWVVLIDIWFDTDLCIMHVCYLKIFLVCLVLLKANVLTNYSKFDKWIKY